MSRFSPDVKAFLSLNNPRNVPDKSDSDSFEEYDAMVRGSMVNSRRNKVRI